MTSHNLPAPADLVAALRRGEPDALALVYREHAGRLLHTLTALLGDRSEAEDAVHDLFVGLPEAMERYQERGALGAWLRRVAVRFGLTRLRTRRRRREVNLAAVAEPEARAAPVDARLAVEAALLTLPEAMRTVVVLKELEGWPHREIAEQLGLSEGAVMTRHCRAMRRLRSALKETR